MTIRPTLLLLAFAFSATATAGTPTGNIAAGKNLFETKRSALKQACTECHGPGGVQPQDNSRPRLAGQYPDYLSKALHDYKTGKRTNSLMGVIAKDLTEQDIADLSAYLGSEHGDIHDLSQHER